jgi:hypothetical protein
MSQIFIKVNANGEISSFENYVNRAEIVTSRVADNTEETLPTKCIKMFKNEKNQRHLGHSHAFRKDHHCSETT